MFSNKNHQVDYITITLENEPDGIFSSAYSDLLYLVNDNIITTIDSNGNIQKKQINQKILSIFPTPDEIWLIDNNDDLYKFSKNFSDGQLVLHNISDFSFGSNSYAAITLSGDLYVWGENYYGMLGVGTTDKIDIPTKVDNINDVYDVSLGYNYSLLLKENGEIYECGLINTVSDNIEPTPIYSDKFQIISNLSCIVNIVSAYDNIAIDNLGNVFYWTNGFESKNENINLESASIVSEILTQNKISECSLGNTFCICLNSNGDVFIFGEDIMNKRRNKAISYINVPTQIEYVKDIENIYAAQNVGYAKKDDTIIILKDYS